MKGGLLINPNYTEDTAFDYFISNSDISVFDSGSSGIILKCVLHNVNNSPYEMIRTSSYSSINKNVRTILIKLCLIKNNIYDDTTFTFKLKDENNNNIDTVIKNVATEKEFINEVEVQRYIFDKTKKFNNPICPCIIYSKHLKIKDDIVLMKKIIDKLNEYNKKIMNDNVLDVYKTNENITIGLIGMEIAEGYEPLCLITDELVDKIKNTKYNSLQLQYVKHDYECMAKLKYIEMAIKTGYSHNDFHDCNFLINTKDKVSFNVPGNIMILDFGDATKIDDMTMEKIKLLYKNNNFTGILNELYKIDDVRDFRNIDSQQYKWLINSDYYTNDIMKILNRQQQKTETAFKQHRGSKKTNKKTHKRKHKTIKKERL